jgi:hypothetical protein
MAMAQPLFASDVLSAIGGAASWLGPTRVQCLRPRRFLLSDALNDDQPHRLWASFDPSTLAQTRELRCICDLDWKNAMAVKPLDTLIACKVINLADGLRQSDRRVGTALIEHYNRVTGRCDPGIERLAALLGYCPRTIIRSTQALERAGLFQKVRHGGYSNRNFYRPNWTRFGELAAAWDQKMRVRPRHDPPRMSLAPRPPSHMEGDTGVTQTCSTNPSQSTCSSGLPNKRTEAVEIRSNTNSFGHRSADAARNEAERRWNRDLDERFRSKPITYSEIVDAITPAIHAAATDAELRHRGAGLDCIIKQLKLGDR